jgi:integrase
MAEGPFVTVKQRGNRFAVWFRLPTRDRGYRSFTSEEAANEYARGVRDIIAKARNQGRTVATAIAAYEELLREKGLRASTLAETPRRLKLFFGVDDEHDGGHLSDLSEHTCEKLYTELRGATYKRGDEERTYSVDTHRNILAECKTFLKWCVGRRWLPGNPLAHVEGVGKRHHGKEQLTIDEARKWDRVALGLAKKGDAGAIAAMLTMRLGLRAGEIVERQVRDLDDEGRLLRVTSAKTDAGVRVVEVSEDLRGMLVKLAKGRGSDELLFGEHWRDWIRKAVARICEVAGVSTVSAHAMRGLHATLAMQAGATSHLVAQALGHESASTTETSYAKKDAIEAARKARGMKVLKGGGS